MHANLKGRMEQRTAKAEHWLKIMETLCTNDLAKGGVLLRLSRHLRRHRGLRLLLLPLGLQFSLKNKLHNYLHFKRSKVRQQSLASGHLAPAPCFHGAARHWTKPRHFLSRKLVLNKYLFSSLCNEKNNNNNKDNIPKVSNGSWDKMSAICSYMIKSDPGVFVML